MKIEERELDFFPLNVDETFAKKKLENSLTHICILGP
jgi:hypothetical protein